MSRKANRSKKFSKGNKKNAAFFANSTVETGKSKSSCSRLDRVLNKCRTTGNLKLSSLKLTEFPDEIYHLSEQDDSKDIGINWWEVEEMKSIDASHNFLTVVPKEVFEFPMLHTLNLHNNQLQTVAAELGDCTVLKKLDLSRNALTELPEVFPDTLTSVSLHENKISVLPDSLTVLPKLCLLNISSNSLKELPKEGHLSIITKFMAQKNQLLALPAWLSSCRALTCLELQENKLRSIPDLSQLHDLTNLVINQNQLTELPTLPGSGSLIELNGNDNSLTNVDNVLTQPNICTVLLQGNKITELPADMAKLKKLKVLDARCNNMQNVPAQFGKCESLKTFEVEGNPLKRIQRSKYTNGIKIFKEYLITRLDPEEEEKIGTGSQCIIEAIKKGRRRCAISLKNLKIDTIPEDIWEVENIKTLDFSENNLDGVKDTLDDIAVFEDSLQVLNMTKNRLCVFPVGILSLDNLKTLSLSFNKLKKLPREMGNLAHLAQLHVSNNQICEFPPPILNMQSLMEIDLSCNRIQYVPLLTGMPNLRKLILNTNKITQIADGIQKMRVLNFLDITANQFQQIPLSLGACPSLKTLLISGNPQKMIPQPIILKGSPYVLTAIRKKMSGSSPSMMQNYKGTGGSQAKQMSGSGMQRGSQYGTGRGQGNLGMSGGSQYGTGRGQGNLGMSGMSMGGMQRGSQYGTGRGRGNPGMSGMSMGGMQRGSQYVTGRGQGNLGMQSRSPNMGAPNTQQIQQLENRILAIEKELTEFGSKAKKYRLKRELEKTKVALAAARKR